MSNSSRLIKRADTANTVNLRQTTAAGKDTLITAVFQEIIAADESKFRRLSYLT